MEFADLLIKKKKDRFTKEEDNRLCTIIEILGVKEWVSVAKMMGTKNWRQCKERWNQFLNPNINKDGWTEEEDDLLLRLHEKYGSKWSLMVSHFKGRPRLQIRNRYNLLMKKQKWKQEIGSPFMVNPSMDEPIIDSAIMEENIISPIMPEPIPEPIIDSPMPEPIPEPIMDQVPITDPIMDQNQVPIMDQVPITDPIMDQVPITDPIMDQVPIYISDNSPFMAEPIDESNLVQKEDETDELYKEYDNFNEFVYDWKLEESTEKTNDN